MVPDQQRLSSEDRSNLVAFLDGELNDDQARVIASKLTQSVTARREADALGKTWELLDLLPRPRASDDFTARTLIIAIRPGRPGDPMVSVVTRRVVAGVVWAAASALLLVLGYFLTIRVWPNPTARLARDLPIAESLDEYRDVGNLEFLELLDAAPEFN
jgi:hypothetical protein